MPTVPPGSEAGVICGGLDVFTRMESACVAACPNVSATRTMNGKLPVAVGAPVIVPVLAFRLRPGGNVPEAMLKVSGPVPPWVNTAWL